MGYCSKCGKQLADDARFCSACGAPVRQDKGGREEAYDGVIHKCPNCGETVDAFEATCPSCGYELRGVASSSRVNDLAMKLEQINDVQQRKELIKNFYIPNTKEDIYEFFILASSNIEAGGDNTDAWYAKLDQAYKKAQLVFGDGQELERLTKLYKETGKARAANSAMSAISNNRWVQAAALFVIGVVLVVVGFTSNSGLVVLGTVGMLPIIGAMTLLFDSEKKK